MKPTHHHLASSSSSTTTSSPASSTNRHLTALAWAPTNYPCLSRRVSADLSWPITTANARPMLLLHYSSTLPSYDNSLLSRLYCRRIFSSPPSSAVTQARFGHIQTGPKSKLLWVWTLNPLQPNPTRLTAQVQINLSYRTRPTPSSDPNPLLFRPRSITMLIQNQLASYSTDPLRAEQTC